MSRYEDIDCYYDYYSIIEDCDELYTQDDHDVTEHSEWENYYHNIASEIVDE